MAYIIKAKWVSGDDFNDTWRDKGSNATSNTQWWAYKGGGNYLACGDAAESAPSGDGTGNWIYHSGKSYPRDMYLVLQDASTDGDVALIPAQSGKQVWTDVGSGADKDGALWQPDTVTKGSDTFYPMGLITMDSHSKEPDFGNYCLVNNNCLEQGGIGSEIWNTEGSGAQSSISLWRVVGSASEGSALISPNTFVATGGYDPPSGSKAPSSNCIVADYIQWEN